MKNKRAVAGYLAMFLIFGLVCTVYGQETPLEESKVTIQITNKPLLTVLVKLMNENGVYVGLEESVLDRDHFDYEFEPNVSVEQDRERLVGLDATTSVIQPDHLFTLDFESIPLKDVMDSIVRQMRHYQWEVRGGIVNIYPKSGRDKRLKDLLDIKISMFKLGRGTSLAQIKYSIMALPEIKAFMKDKGLSYTMASFYASAFKDRLIQEDIVITNVTFGELLNQVTKQKGGGWRLLMMGLPEERPKTDTIHLEI